MDKGRDCEESSLSVTHANRETSRGSSYGKLQGGTETEDENKAASIVDASFPPDAAATDDRVLGIPSTGEGPEVMHELIS